MSGSGTLRLLQTVGIVAALAVAGAPPAAADNDQAAGGGRADASRLESIFGGFYSVSLDVEHPLQIQNFTLTKDALELTLKQGTVYLARPLEGEVTGAYFVGEGTMKVVPPSKTEKKSLKRGYGKESFEEPINEAVIRFDDGTDKQLQAVGRAGTPAGTDPAPEWVARNKIEYNADDVQLDFIEKTLGGVTGRDFFTLEAKTAAGKWVDFIFRERYSIEASLYEMHALGVPGKRGFETWCDFHKKSDYDTKGNYTPLPEADDKEPAVLRDVKMSAEIPSERTVVIDALDQVESRVDHLGIIRFSLINNREESSWEDREKPVTVDLVTDEKGTPLPYIHKWHQLVVLLPRPMARGERASIRVRATEDTVVSLASGGYWVFNAYAWYPELGYGGGRHTFDWTVKTAKPMKAIASGELVKEWDDGKMNCAEWRSATPLQHPALIFGDLVRTDSVYTREAPGSGQVPIYLYGHPGWNRSPEVNKENILFNAQQGLKAYESLFGPYPYRELKITQWSSKFGFGQSAPGFVLLSRLTGVALGGGRSNGALFHELAHEWWGGQVGWAGPEDYWISESWAEYFAGLIIQGTDPAKFDAMRKDWKRVALEADSHATLATGFRSAYEPGLLYAKGPYVVHMLRTWMGWEKFSKLVSTLQSKYKDHNINTDTIAREAGALMGYDMFPFFDQWVRDQGIPKVHYTWSAEPEPDGKMLVTIKTSQEDKENFKILMVPIAFDFGKEKPVMVAKPILTPEAEIKIKVPVRPQKIVLDPEESQLADFIADRS